MVGQSKREYRARIKDRYRHAGRKGKSRILDEFCAVCGHHRKHAIRLLSKDGRIRIYLVTGKLCQDIWHIW